MRSKVELVRLADFQTVHEGVQDAEADLRDVPRTSRLAAHDNWRNGHFRQVHRVLMPDGGIVTKDHYAPMFRLDARARRVRTRGSMIFHLSTEIDADGNIWAPPVTEPSAVEGVPDNFRDDTIVRVSPEGETLFQRLIVQLLIDNGLSRLMFSNDRHYPDPLRTDLPGGASLIEDSRDARFMIVSADCKVAADFVNRSGDGHIYQLGWSRYIDQGYGDRVVDALTKVDCNE